MAKMAQQERITVSLKKHNWSGRHEGDTICDTHRVTELKY